MFRVQAKAHRECSCSVTRGVIPCPVPPSCPHHPHLHHPNATYFIVNTPPPPPSPPPAKGTPLDPTLTHLVGSSGRTPLSSSTAPPLLRGRSNGALRGVLHCCLPGGGAKPKKNATMWSPTEAENVSVLCHHPPLPPTSHPPHGTQMQPTGEHIHPPSHGRQQ